MNTRRIAIVALCLWVVTIGGIATMMIRGNTHQAADGRTAVMLSKSDRDFVLTEMRAMLGAVHDVTAAIAANDRAALIAAAKRAGMGAVGHEPPTLMAAMPLDVKTAGFGMHAAFDDLAQLTAAGVPAAEQSAQLAQLLQRCIGCHAQYRFDIKD